MAHPTPRGRGPVTQYNAAKNYLEQNNIPKMFECLIASLMMEKPENPYQHLDQKLNTIKEIGLENVNWDTFIEHLHPTKDPIRIETIQDETSLKIKKAAEEKNKTASQTDYQPDVFQLTEPDDEEAEK